MARVPQVTTGGATVDVRPVAPSYQQTSGLLVDAIQSRGAAQNIENAAQKVEGVSNVLANEAVKAQMEDNERAAKKADVAFSEQTRAIMFGDGTPENPGYYGLKGEAALAAYPKVREQLTEARKKIGGDLPNVKAREMFELSAAGRLDSEGRSMDRHNVQERVTANNAIGQSRINTAISDAINRRSNPEMVAEQEAIVRGEVTSRERRNGITDQAVIANSIREEMSKMYSGMIAAELTANPMNAQKIYDKYKTVIDGPTRTTIEKALEGGVMLQQVQEQTDRIVNGKGTTEQKREMAKELTTRGFDPKVRDGVLKAVEHEEDRRIAKALQGEALADKAALRSASLAVQKGQPVLDWQRENPVAAARVMGIVGATDNLYRAERNLAEGSIYARHEDDQSTRTMTTLRRMSTKDLAEVDLEPYKPLLTKDLFNKAMAYQASAQRQMSDTLADRSSYNYGHSALAKYAPTKLVNGVNKPDVESPDFQTARNELNLFIDSFTSQGKKPTTAQIDAEAARLMLPVTVETPFYAADKKTIGATTKYMTDDQRKAATVPIKKIHAETLALIRASFAENGVPDPSNSQIEALAGAMAVNDLERKKAILGIK